MKAIQKKNKKWKCVNENYWHEANFPVETTFRKRSSTSQK